MVALPTQNFYFFIQKKLFDLFFSKENTKTFDKFFMMKNFLTVHELHVYELLEFVLRSIAGLHSEPFLNELL